MRRPLGQEESKAKDSSFPYDASSSTSEASPTQPRRMKLAGLMPGKKYKLTVTAHYSNGESIPSEEQVFTTKPAGTYLGVHGTCKCVWCIVSHITIVFHNPIVGIRSTHEYCDLQ